MEVTLIKFENGGVNCQYGRFNHEDLKDKFQEEIYGTISCDLDTEEVRDLKGFGKEKPRINHKEIDGYLRRLFIKKSFSYFIDLF